MPISTCMEPQSMTTPRMDMLPKFIQTHAVASAWKPIPYAG